MRINIIFDLEMYKWVLVPVMEELARRGHTPIISYAHEDTKIEADVSLGIQDVAWRGIEKVRPRFFINHGASATKEWDLRMDIDYFIGQSAYWTNTLLEKMNCYPYKYNVISGTGWPKMDLLHQFRKDKEIIKSNIYAHLNLPKKPMVLCFPTYKKNIGPGGPDNMEKPWVRTEKYYDIYETLRKDYNVFVFPHEMDDTPEFNFIPEKDRVVKTHDVRRLHFHAAADLVVTDASGISFETAGMDIPMVLMSPNGEIATLEGKSDGLKVDMGPWVKMNGLKEAVAEQIRHPELYADRRAFWSDYILGPVDGHVAARIVDEMEKIVG